MKPKIILFGGNTFFWEFPHRAKLLSMDDHNQPFLQSLSVIHQPMDPVIQPVNPSLQHYYHESALKLFQRMQMKPLHAHGIKPFDANELGNGLRAGSILELIGESGTGKTELLYQLLINCISPEKWNGIPLGGDEHGVIFIDNDYHFNSVRVAELLASKLTKALSDVQIQMESDGEHNTIHSVDLPQALTPYDMDLFVKSCLERLYIINCIDTIQFLITLKTLPKLIESVGNIKLLMVDSISSFFWLDKVEDEQGKAKQRKMCKQLSTLVNEHNLILFATRAVLFKHNSEATTKDYIAGWGDHVQFRFLFWKDHPRGVDSNVPAFHVQRIHPTPSKNTFHFVINTEGLEFV